MSINSLPVFNADICHKRPKDLWCNKIKILHLRLLATPLYLWANTAGLDQETLHTRRNPPDFLGYIQQARPNNWSHPNLPLVQQCTVLRLCRIMTSLTHDSRREYSNWFNNFVSGENQKPKTKHEKRKKTAFWTLAQRPCSRRQPVAGVSSATTFNLYLNSSDDQARASSHVLVSPGWKSSCRSHQGLALQQRRAGHAFRRIGSNHWVKAKNHLHETIPGYCELKTIKQILRSTSYEISK